MSVRVLYFARMAEVAGRAQETIAAVPATAAELHALLDKAHDFGFDRGALRVAVNDKLVDWDAPLRDGDEVALIPPVSGG